jgi:predicted RNA binding protein YcfA (HicA-like mRNA interferase family)
MERNSRKLKKLLEADGWYEVTTRGSHVQFKHPDKLGRVTLPHPKKDLKEGTVKSVYKQAGWL